MMTKDDKKKIISAALDKYGSEIRRKDLDELTRDFGFTFISYNTMAKYRKSRGIYDIAKMAEDLGLNVESSDSFETKTEKKDSSANVQNVGITASKSLVPAKDNLYVKTSEYKTLEKIVDSGAFFPVFITGMSGNGKSLSVIQAAANKKRELIRINVTKATSDDDLIGHWTLNDGNTKWVDGPVTEGLRRGAIVLIDEIDMLDANRAAGLFTILEGKGVYIKQTNEMVHPTPGFNVIATANTKGKGSEDGRFMGTNVLNEAFLERFPVTLEYAYPGKSHEKKILKKLAEYLEILDEDFIENLVDWASIIRKTFTEGAVDEVISTRRLVAIMNGYSIFKDKRMSIEMAINRFDSETKESFMSLYEKLDANLISADEEGNEVSVSESMKSFTENEDEPNF